MYLIQERPGNSWTDPSKHKQTQMSTKRVRASTIEHKQKPNEHDQAAGTSTQQTSVTKATLPQSALASSAGPRPCWPTYSLLLLGSSCSRMTPSPNSECAFEDEDEPHESQGWTMSGGSSAALSGRSTPRCTPPSHAHTRRPARPPSASRPTTRG